MIYVGYMCRKKLIGNVFSWSDDFNTLVLNNAFAPKLYRRDTCRDCDKKCLPKKIKIKIERFK
jgi:hypothetical protein